MKVIDSLTSKAGQLAEDLQESLKRARVEGERRLLQRQHRAALEDLGLRTYELVRAGDLPEEPIAAEVAAVESRLIEIEAKVTEIERMKSDGEADPTGSETATDASDDPALTAFPMLEEAPGGGDGEPEAR